MSAEAGLADYTLTAFFFGYSKRCCVDSLLGVVFVV